MTVHILNQHIWPDASPITIYTEHLAVDLDKQGIPIRIVGGSGVYRFWQRPKPQIELVSLEVSSKFRDNFFQVLTEYFLVHKKLFNYLMYEVKDGDVVIASSASFLNVFLINTLRKKSVKSFYWLFDYFPESASSLIRAFKLLTPILNFIWAYWLKKWGAVISVSENLGYRGSNAQVFRLWPTIDFKGVKKVCTPNKRALFTGNLGITHDVESFIKVSKKLTNQGYTLDIYADGPGVKLLPKWMSVSPANKSESELFSLLLDHDLHLIVGTKDNDKGSFPSKLWNSLASGKEILPIGFKGLMYDEFNASINSDFLEHRKCLSDHIINLIHK